MDQTPQQQLGRKGEDLAAAYLEEQGHRLIKRNFRAGRGELDIVSLAGDTLVISEVKSYHGRPLGAAEFRVNRHKRQQVIAAAYAFLAQFEEHRGRDVRFDVLIVDFNHYPARITHHQAAFWDEQGWGSE